MSNNVCTDIKMIYKINPLNYYVTHIIFYNNDYNFLIGTNDGIIKFFYLKSG